MLPTDTEVAADVHRLSKEKFKHLYSYVDSKAHILESG